jgi:hypothetical protein
MDRPAWYEIRIRGQLDAGWSDWLGEMAISTEEMSDGCPITVLSGIIVDQAALHGILARLRDLNLIILTVERNANGKETDDVREQPRA